MEGYGGPAQPSPPIGDALNAGRFLYLEVKGAGCNTHSAVDLTTLRRPRETPIWQLEQRILPALFRDPRLSFTSVATCGCDGTNITTRQEPWYPGDERDRH
jgi:hypothetical protein